MQRNARGVVVLGTGGTIAGESASADDDLVYRSAALPVATLAGVLTPPAGVTLESEQVAQLDSKDMDATTWRTLALRVHAHLARDEVEAVIVTHGTDTLEETAYFLERVLRPTKRVVLTAAMRPATSPRADGPQNLRDALAVALGAPFGGVVVVVAGIVHAAVAVRKVHPQRLDAFGSGDDGPLARVVDGEVRLARAPALRDHAAALDVAALPADAAEWPWVEIVTSCAAADARGVRALLGAGVDGLVVAATGNGTLHHALEAPLRDAASRGCAVLRATRCLAGAIVEPVAAVHAPPSAGALTPQQARVELIVRLLERRFAEHRKGD